MRAVVWILSLTIFAAIATAAYASSRRAETMRRVTLSTVVIYADYKDAIAQGSGTVIGRFGEWAFVLTCHHVVKDALSIVVHPTGHAKATRAAYLEVGSPDHDLALLAVKGLDLPALPISVSDPELYDTVYLFGAPQGQQGTASEGIVTDLKYKLSKLPPFFRVTNAFVDHGISGGTATNTEGELVGVPARGMDGTPQFGLLVPRTLVLMAIAGYANATH